MACFVIVTIKTARYLKARSHVKNSKLGVLRYHYREQFLSQEQ